MGKKDNFYLWNVETQQIVEVPAGSILGRGDDAYYYIDSESSSRHHFQLTRGTSGVPVIIDLDSSNGTYLNGLGIDGKGKIKIKSYDIITVGELHYVFFNTQDIKNFSKEKLEKSFSPDFPKEFQEVILKKVIAFERYAVSKLNRIFKYRVFTDKIDDAEEDKNLELEKLRQKRAEVDLQKEKLDQLVKEKMAVINKNYEKLKKLEAKAINQFNTFLEGLEVQRRAVDIDETDLFSKYFHSSIERENNLIPEEEKTSFKTTTEHKAIVKGLDLGSSSSIHFNHDEDQSDEEAISKDSSES